MTGSMTGQGSWDDTVAEHKARLTERIGKVALSLAAQSGIANVSMRQLAAEVGIARQTLYNYVPDVSSAIAGYLAARAEAFDARLRGALAAEADPARRLRRYVTEVIGYLAGEEHRVGAGQMIAAGASGAHAEALRASQRRLHDELRAIIAEGIGDGTFRKDLDPNLVTSLIEHLVAGAGTSLARGTADAADAVDTVIALLESGLRESPGSATAQAPRDSARRRIP
jgi:AcrR family transcriptional regulator